LLIFDLKLISNHFFSILSVVVRVMILLSWYHNKGKNLNNYFKKNLID